MLNDLIQERFKKLSLLKEAKINPYPARARRSFLIAEVLSNFNLLLHSKKVVYLTGRIIAMRDQGGIIFIDIEDESGKIQVVLKKAIFPKFDFWGDVLDRGDFVNVGGLLFLTKKGEKSLEVKYLKILAKSLRPLPTKWFGLEDIETRLRKRYLDLLMNPEVKDIFRKKAVFWETLRDFLKNEGFLEVETPVLENSPGGADAEPFVTHHNALNEDFFLRISLELPLKKILVGGFEKVFEIGRIFRNEGIDREHLQDYTQLEFYWAYKDYNDGMKFVERMFKTVIKKVCGRLVSSYQKQKIDWSKKWPKIDYVKIFEKFNKINPLQASEKELFQKAESLGLEPKVGLGKGRLIDLIFKKTVRPTLIQPCFLIDPPVEIEPLAKRNEKNPLVVERYQVMACGTELGKGYSELNDPLDQRARFEEQMRLREKGDKEAQRLDEDFLEALEY